jgi:hydroxypyruvate isomerase
MPKFAANLSMMYVEVPFLDRFELAARDGFKAVEYLFPYAWPAKELSSRLKDNGLEQVLMNAPPGGVDTQSIDQAWSAGQRGLSSLPEYRGEFREGFKTALEYALVLECPRIHVMAGLIPEAQRALSSSPASLRTSSDAVHTNSSMRDCYLENLRWASDQAKPHAKDVLIEPINTRDIPHFFLNKQSDAHEIILETGCTNLKVQMDLFHCQIVEGDIAAKITEYLPTQRVGHFQIAGVPKRHEPDTGELNYPVLFDLIDDLSRQHRWSGWIGCEYHPLLGREVGGTSRGLGWIRQYQKV